MRVRRCLSSGGALATSRPRRLFSFACCLPLCARCALSTFTDDDLEAECQDGPEDVCREAALTRRVLARLPDVLLGRRGGVPMWIGSGRLAGGGGRLEEDAGGRPLSARALAARRAAWLMLICGGSGGDDGGGGSEGG